MSRLPSAAIRREHAERYDAVAAVGGVATFTDLSLNKTAAGYTLTASATGFSAVTSSAFDITPGTATQLLFSQQPTTTVAGQPIAPGVAGNGRGRREQPRPRIHGERDRDTRQQSGREHAHRTTTVATVNGVATFGDLSLNKSATATG